uniref:SH3 domain protein n=1 Tax=Candidatus Kentrum sp. DK TaxID=2126562 RepID=A0A450RY07_9GAMM|nr:MAG: SH3 domain protein [Candidatus Kentron sp. DK]VFJ50795.1 MAG: SH3 domain protein [Candidatus Kentron sp. DK]
MPLRIRLVSMIIVCLLGCLSGSALAETSAQTAGEETGEMAYVIDRLLVGVYKDETLTGTALEVLPTGASMEILTRQEEIARVRTGNGIEGWVDNNYLMKEKPAQLLLLEAEAAHEKTKEVLREAERRLRELEAENPNLVSSGISFGFPSHAEPLPPPMTVRQWIFLIFSFLLALSVGGLIIYGVIHRRYYLLDR